MGWISEPWMQRACNMDEFRHQLVKMPEESLGIAGKLDHSKGHGQVERPSQPGLLPRFPVYGLPRVAADRS